MIDAIAVWRTPGTKQARGHLIDDRNGTRCALGKLCGEAARTGTEANDWLVSEGYKRYGIETHPDILRRCPWCSDALRPFGAAMIIHWNDDHELTFDQIADLAEQHPELVFVQP